MDTTRFYARKSFRRLPKALEAAEELADCEGEGVDDVDVVIIRPESIIGTDEEEFGDCLPGLTVVGDVASKPFFVF